MATLAAIVQPFADAIAVLESMPGLYDLDVAVGDQLDTDGLWIGRSRNLQVPIANSYFSFDITGLGFGQGVWMGPFDPTTGLVVLDDETYRLYLRATVAENNWDGTIPGAYAALDPLLDPIGIRIDDDHMAMNLSFTGGTPIAIIAALFTGQYIALRPAGVMQNGP